MNDTWSFSANLAASASKPGILQCYMPSAPGTVKLIHSIRLLCIGDEAASVARGWPGRVPEKGARVHLDTDTLRGKCCCPERRHALFRSSAPGSACRRAQELLHTCTCLCRQIKFCASRRPHREGEASCNALVYADATKTHVTAAVVDETHRSPIQPRQHALDVSPQSLQGSIIAATINMGPYGWPYDWTSRRPLGATGRSCGERPGAGGARAPRSPR